MHKKLKVIELATEFFSTVIANQYEKFIHAICGNANRKING